MPWEDRNEILRSPTNWEEYGEPFMEILRSLVPGGISYNKRRSGGQVTGEEVAQDLANLVTLGASGGLRGASALGRNLLNQRAYAKAIPEFGEALYRMGTPLTNIPKAIGRKVAGWGQRAWEAIPVLDDFSQAVPVEAQLSPVYKEVARRNVDDIMGRLNLTIPYVEPVEDYAISVIPKNNQVQSRFYQELFGNPQQIENTGGFFRPLIGRGDKWLGDIASVVREKADPSRVIKHELGHQVYRRTTGYGDNIVGIPENRMARDKFKLLEAKLKEDPTSEYLARRGLLFSDYNTPNKEVEREVIMKLAGLSKKYPEVGKKLIYDYGYRDPYSIMQEVWTRGQAKNKLGFSQSPWQEVGLPKGPPELNEPFWEAMHQLRKEYTHPAWYDRTRPLPGPPALMSYLEQILTKPITIEP